MRGARSWMVWLVMCLLTGHAQGQYVNPNVTWGFSAQRLSDDEFELALKATIAPGFHFYSQHIEEGGPIPTQVTFSPSAHYRLIGKVTEHGNRKQAREPVFDNMELIWFEDQVVFKQKVQLLRKQVRVEGFITFMTCNDELCDPPSDQHFAFDLEALSLPESDAGAAAEVQESAPNSVLPLGDTTLAEAPAPAAPVQVPKISAGQNYLSTFLAGFATGLIALLFPCVWPVIPLTVSYFLKHSRRNPARGRWNAFLYGLSITIIFVVMGVFISLVTNSQQLNEWSTGWFFNMIFFILFFLFGLSFLGVFEITLPSGLVNKSEKLSEKGGMVGIFFMAFTLVLVSFSCTLPFVANLIAMVSSGGEFLRPLIGFTAFGLALGLPFGLFAWFPTYLNKLPKSGNWMHVLKVSFGFIEIALSFIYLSKVDMAYHWQILSRDVFLAIWIVLFAVLGFYLLGKIKLHAEHDDAPISVGRLLMGMLFLAFSLYMVPGLWGAPLKGLSAFLPNYSEFRINHGASEKARSSSNKKYADLFEAPHGLDMYFDYDEALEAARQEQKPLFVDFTGWGCVNCRKMEKTVWADESILDRLKNNFVVVSLYVDDRTPLPEAERYYSQALKKKVVTLGDRNFDIQYSKFRMGAQPYYVILDGKENVLVPPVGYTPNIQQYADFLDQGVRAFNASLLATHNQALPLWINKK